MAVSQPATHHLPAARQKRLADRVVTSALHLRSYDADVVRSAKNVSIDESNSSGKDQRGLYGNRPGCCAPLFGSARFDVLSALLLRP
jgi:hypothetical protein